MTKKKEAQSKNNTRLTAKKRELCRNLLTSLLTTIETPPPAVNDLKHRIHLVEINLAIIGENHSSIKGIKTLIQELSNIVQQIEQIEKTPATHTEVLHKILELIG